ncbi:MAG TPA: hypothetical protein VNQ33_02895 [Acidimicrobiales bacterium]|nr:hypothetical protein [Acidimicrobiales bacterium]
MAAPDTTTAHEGADAISDEELERLALAASPDEVPDDAVAWSPTARDPLIADWYMPAPVAARRDLKTRVITGTVVASIIAINAAGLCVTYGRVILG